MSVRLPTEPLFEVLKASQARGRRRDGVELAGIPAPVGYVATRVGVRPRTVQRWVAEGGVPIDTADRAAVRAGFHPAEVWGEEWWAACWDQDRIDREHAELIEQARAERRAQGGSFLDLVVDPVRDRRDLVVDPVRDRRDLVAGYRAVERCRERGGHRCAVDGCCAPQKSTQKSLRAVS